MSAAPLLTVRVQIVSATGTRLSSVELNLDLASTLADVLDRVVLEGMFPPQTVGTFRGRDGTSFQLEDTLREVAACSGITGGVLELILMPLAAPGMAAGAPATPPLPLPAWSVEPCDFDLVLLDENEEEPTIGSAPEVPPTPVASREPRAPGQARRYKRASTERRATVRYYTRMNPDRMFPLLVILSAKEIEEVVKAKVKQAASEAFQVEEGSSVEIEPVLPGCDVYPPRHTLAVDDKDTVTESFWIVPRVLGRVHGARVLIRQGDRVLAEVKLDVKVAKQTLAVVCGLLSLAAPYLTMGLKSLKLDYESQKADGFPLYQQAGKWIVENLRPEWLGLGFLGLAFLLYLWMRPRRRDVFWDVNVK